MILANKLGLTIQVELAKAEEKLSKQKAKGLYYDFAGKIRTVNIAKGNFRFVPVMYLEHSL